MPAINGRFYSNPAYGRGVERARLAERASEAGEELNGRWVTINHHHIFIDESESGPNQFEKSSENGKRLEFKYQVSIGALPYSRTHDVVQPPSFFDIGLTPIKRLAPGLYRVEVSLTRAGKDNGKGIDVEIEAGVDNVQGASGALKGVQELPTGTSKIPLNIAISAKHGDPGYEGRANLNIVVSGPNDEIGIFSIPVEVEKGNRGAPTVVGRSGGRTSFVVPE